MTTISEPNANSIDLADLDAEIRRHLHFTLGFHERHVSPRYMCRATALAVRDRLLEAWLGTQDPMRDTDQRRVYYLSLEFLIGRSLVNSIQNLDLDAQTRDALHQYGLTLEEVAEKEHDAGLGNGGLGRLAACFLDSCANLKLPVFGYGIRYEYGMFHQHIENGRQVEDPDHWLRDGNPWELERPEESQHVKFYGHTQHYRDTDGTPRCRWAGSHDVIAVPFDMPIPGYRNQTVNTLRLWKATATDAFNLEEFNSGSYP
ncbi:MAG: glycogen/starch/alpha-glucan phosphorylase [Planctomycetales bacterium]|nr:glycogen/starch/alpha-glucan phosphorylase [Planctomycetales bacterium]